MNDIKSRNFHMKLLLGLILGIILAVVSFGVLLNGLAQQQSRLLNSPVAIVDEDAIVTGKTPMAAGRTLSADLITGSVSTPNDKSFGTTSKSSNLTQLSWTLTSADDASQGLSDGEYYAVVTIPHDFSSSVLSLGTSDPKQAVVTVQTNDSSNALISQISQNVVTAASQSLGTNVTNSFVTKMVGGLNSTSQGLSNAATGANQVSIGAASLAASTQQLYSGTTQLSGGLAQLSQGSTSLVSSLAQTSQAVNQLQTGVQSALDAESKLTQAQQDVAQGTTKLNTGMNAAAKGVNALADGAGKLGSSTATMSQSMAAYSDKMTQFDAGLAKLAKQCAALTTPSGTSTAGPTTAPSANANDINGTTATNQLASMCHAITDLSSQSTALNAGAKSLASSSSTLATSTASLGDGAQQAASAQQSLTDSSQKLSSSTESLATSSAQALQGLDKVSGGISQLSAGMDQLLQGSGQLASGVQQAGSSAQLLAEGGSQLSAGSTQLGASTQQLANSLGKAATQSPKYSANQTSKLAATASQPIGVAGATDSSPAPGSPHAASIGNSTVLGAVIALMLWLSALIVAQSQRHDASARRLAYVNRRSLIIGSLESLGVGALAAAAGYAVLHGSSAWSWQMAAVMPLGALACYLLANAMLTLMGSGFGSAIFLILGAFQAACLGLFAPIQTAPSAIQWLNQALPVPIISNAIANASALNAGTSMLAPVLIALLIIGIVTIPLLLRVSLPALPKQVASVPTSSMARL